MKVSDILRVKGNTLFTVTPDEPLGTAMSFMAEKDIGSLVVMSHGKVVGMLTFREVIQAVVRNGGAVGASLVRDVYGGVQIQELIAEDPRPGAAAAPRGDGLPAADRAGLLGRRQGRRGRARPAKNRVGAGGEKSEGGFAEPECQCQS